VSLPKAAWAVFDIFSRCALKGEKTSSQVWEVLDALKVLFSSGDDEIWKGRLGWRLRQDFRLCGIHSETKTRVSGVEVVDQLLEMVGGVGRGTVVVCILELCDRNGVGQVLRTESEEVEQASGKTIFDVDSMIVLWDHVEHVREV